MLGAESIIPRYIKNVYITGATFDDNNKDPNYQLGFNVYVWGSTEHVIENININYCTITNHLRYGVRFYDFDLEGYENVVIDATCNYWGSPTGPCRQLPNGKWVGKGDKVSSNVDFTPWLPHPIEFWHHLLQE